jgi:hypothetical protein
MNDFIKILNNIDIKPYNESNAGFLSGQKGWIGKPFQPFLFFIIYRLVHHLPPLWKTK